jgi:hypothetical protein
MLLLVDGLLGSVLVALNPAFVFMQEEHGFQQLNANPSLEEPAFWNQFCFLYPILISSIVSLSACTSFPATLVLALLTLVKGKSVCESYRPLRWALLERTKASTDTLHVLHVAAVRCNGIFSSTTLGIDL